MNKKETGANLAIVVADALNGGASPRDFCETMQHEHRTLQQAFTRLCAEWLKTCGKDDYGFDGRNEASHELGLRVKPILDNTTLPYI